MGVLSKYGVILFEVLNEVFVGLGSGILGLTLLFNKTFNRIYFLRATTITSLVGISLLCIMVYSEQEEPSRKKVVFITGCDTGLGYSLARHIIDTGFTVMACFLDLNSPGALELKEYGTSQIIQVQLNLKDLNSIQDVVNKLQLVLEDKEMSLYAVINNAAVMIFGEFEWFTPTMIADQLNVNLLGTMLITHKLCPIVRKYKSRIINITSHCSIASLPTLSIYGATKSGLRAWNDSLRIEMRAHGVTVINFIPGSFVTQSRIMANQDRYFHEMQNHFSDEQKAYYSHYFCVLRAYLSFVRNSGKPKKIEDENMYDLFEDALLKVYPKAVYKNETWRYMIYHKLFEWSPVFLRDYFVLQFMQLPERP